MSLSSEAGASSGSGQVCGSAAADTASRENLWICYESKSAPGREYTCECPPGYYFDSSQQHTLGSGVAELGQCVTYNECTMGADHRQFYSSYYAQGYLYLYNKGINFQPEQRLKHIVLSSLTTTLNPCDGSSGTSSPNTCVDGLDTFTCSCGAGFELRSREIYLKAPSSIGDHLGSFAHTWAKGNFRKHEVCVAIDDCNRYLDTRTVSGGRSTKMPLVDASIYKAHPLDMAKYTWTPNRIRRRAQAHSLFEELLNFSSASSSSGDAKTTAGGKKTPTSNVWDDKIRINEDSNLLDLSEVDDLLGYNSYSSKKNSDKEKNMKNAILKNRDQDPLIPTQQGMGMHMEAAVHKLGRLLKKQFQRSRSRSSQFLIKLGNVFEDETYHARLHMPILHELTKSLLVDSSTSSILSEILQLEKQDSLSDDLSFSNQKKEGEYDSKQDHDAMITTDDDLEERQGQSTSNRNGSNSTARVRVHSLVK